MPPRLVAWRGRRGEDLAAWLGWVIIFAEVPCCVIVMVGRGAGGRDLAARLKRLLDGRQDPAGENPQG